MHIYIYKYIHICIYRPNRKETKRVQRIVHTPSGTHALALMGPRASPIIGPHNARGPHGLALMGPLQDPILGLGSPMGRP